MKPSDFLTELSTDKLAQYKTAAAADASKADKEGDFKRGDKRFSGIVKATKKQFANDTKQGVAEGLDEAVGGNYLYHSTQDANTAKQILSSGYILGSNSGKQPASDAQTTLPTVSFGRSIGYQTSGVNVDRDYQVVFVFDRASIETRYKTLGTSQSQNVRGLANPIDTEWGGKVAKLGKVWGLDANADGKVDYKEIGNVSKSAASNMVKKGVSAKLNAPKAGGEFEEIVPTKTGKIPLQGLLVGFYLVPGKAASKDPELLNDPRRLDMPRPNQFVKAAQPQGVAEGSSNNIPTIGINVRNDGNIDYASLIVDGGKKYESRKTDSLRPYVGKTVGIVRTGNGPAVAIGQVTIGEPIVVDAEKFNRLRKQHLVPQGSKFDIDSDGKKYLYPMIDPVRWDNEKTIKHRGIVSRKIQEQGVAEEQHSCPHCGGEMVSEELMNEKKDACYYKVKSRYSVWPSAYASGALVKCRNKGASNWGNGGKKNESSILEGIESVDESLHDWFSKEKWVRMDTKGNIKGPCAREPGEGKPKCLPQSKAHSLGKKGRASAAARKRREDPNPDRSGKAINVNTKKKD